MKVTYNRTTKSFSKVKSFSSLLSDDTYVVVYDDGNDLDYIQIKDASTAENAKKKALDYINRGLSDDDKAKMNDIKHCRLFKAGTQDYMIDDWFNSLTKDRRYSNEGKVTFYLCEIVGDDEEDKDPAHHKTFNLSDDERILGEQINDWKTKFEKIDDCKYMLCIKYHDGIIDEYQGPLNKYIPSTY